MRAFLHDKTILITGGTGSFGHRFVATALTQGVNRVIVLSRDELKQHDMAITFGHDPRLRFFVGDVRDRERLNRAFQARVDVVVHAAALKQVPTCEYNPFEAIKTNVLGAQHIVDAAIDCGVPKVIALSTDKAVGPTNLYGASKLCAEKIFVQGNSYSGDRQTRFSCVRYGNVVGSRGSVVPVFLKQRGSGGIQVTDARMTRFWITLQQAVDFVIRCAGEMVGGEVFVPRLPSMGIMDLAKAIAPDCSIEYTGIRPGEKLHESLISVDEARHSLAYESMFVICPEFHWWGDGNRRPGEKVPDGFVYSSDNNDRWLSVGELQEMVQDCA